MDIGELSAWGEFVGGFASLLAAAGVIITLLYLARQIRQQSDQLTAQSRYNYFQTRIDLTKSLATDPIIGAAFAKTRKGEQVTDEENYRALLFTMALLTGWEYEFGEYRAGRLQLEDLDLDDKRTAYRAQKRLFDSALKASTFSPAYRAFLREQAIGP